MSGRNLFLHGRTRTPAAFEDPRAQGGTDPLRGAPDIEMPRGRDPMATRVDMTKSKPPGIRNGHVQLLAQILQALRARIVFTGRETPMGPEKPELEGNPDPAVKIEVLNEPRVVEIQAPAFHE